MNNSFESANYKEIYKANFTGLVRFAAKYVSDYVSEDIVQESFLKLWDKGFYLLPREEVVRLLYVTTKNTCIDYLRHLHVKQKSLEKEEYQLLIEELDASEFSDESLHLRELILRSIEELPDRNREVFTLAYLKEKKTKEIATLLNLSTRTVENLLYRSLQSIRKKCFVHKKREK